MKREIDIDAYLYFGYIPNKRECSILRRIVGWLEACKDRRLAYRQMAYRQLLEKGIEAFRSAVMSMVGRSTRLHVVPLSGGYDSRLILAELLRLGLRDQVVAVTFGTPKTLDYEIGGLVARKLGVRHEYINLEKTAISREGLVQTIRTGARWTFAFDAYFNSLVKMKFGSDATYWSGFMGDPSAGSHLRPQPTSTWEEAKEHFVRANRFGTFQLHRSGWNPLDVLPEKPYCEKAILDFDDQLNFGIRQEDAIYNIVVGAWGDVKTPFYSHDWITFSLSLPRHYRLDRTLFVDMVVKAYPEVFSLPTKNTWGLSPTSSQWKLMTRRFAVRTWHEVCRRLLPGLAPPHPMENYIDFDRAIRERPDLRRLVSDSLESLIERKLVTWVDIKGLWHDHIAGRRRYGQALRILTSLEMNLQVNDEERTT